MSATSISTLPGSTIAAFILLAVAMATLWAQRPGATPRDAGWWWTLPFALSVAAALGGGVLDWRGLAILLRPGRRLPHASTSTVPTVNAAAHS